SQIGSASGVLRSASGEIRSAWKIDSGELSFTFQVPFDTEAEIVLPDAKLSDVEACLKANNCGDRVRNLRQAGPNVALDCSAGAYNFRYTPATPYRKIYSLDSPWEELRANPKTLAVLEKEFNTKEDHIPFDGELYTLGEMTWGPFTAMPQAKREKLDKLLRAVE
ncbi:MAG: alfa-L-rhamnosidase RamA, partial [Oscillibacter sp.]|nr:alfa-L-rhamnosidase RamA [Oscillibacter sp.]